MFLYLLFFSVEDLMFHKFCPSLPWLMVYHCLTAEFHQMTCKVQMITINSSGDRTSSRLEDFKRDPLDLLKFWLNVVFRILIMIFLLDPAELTNIYSIVRLMGVFILVV